MPPNAPAPACKAAAIAATSAAAAAAAAAGSQKPWLFVGLGNPGWMYKGTRHNIGFDMIDAIAEAEGISVSSKQFKAKVGKGGGHGGHNGMRSIIGHLKQSRDFPRLRIGIGRPQETSVISFVLGSFTMQEREEMDAALQRGLQALRIMVLEGFNKGAIFVNTPHAIRIAE